MQHRQTRRPADFTTILKDRSGRIPVRVNDVTEGGVSVEGTGLPPVGAACTLEILDRAVAGRIRWRARGRAGLCFDAALDARAVAVLRQVPLSSLPPGRRRDFGFAEL